VNTVTPVLTEATFTPVNEALARQWLARNTCNRPLRNRRVEEFARDMVNGHWVPNGETIKFAIGPDGEEVLVDGQHRLWAVVEASKDKPGLEIEFLVVQNLAPEAMMTVDNVAKRNYGDYLAMHGQRGSSRVTTLATRVTNWDRVPSVRMPNVHTRATLTPSEVHAWFSANREAAIEAINMGGLVASKLKIQHQATVPGYFLLARVDQATAKDYFQNLVAWTRLGVPRHPILSLVSTINTRKARPGGLPADEALALIIMCWNALAEQKRAVANYNMPRGGLNGATFPTPVRPKWL
jgi:hypothetical protein